jgi:GMP reductase
LIIEDGKKLDFKDVLFKPMRSTLKSRSEVSLSRKLEFRYSSKIWNGVPIMSANMDTTGTFETADVLIDEQMLTAIHKHYTVEDWGAYLDTKKSQRDVENVERFVIPSIGASDTELEKLNAIMKIADFWFICIDVANGYGEWLGDFVRKVREQYPDKIIIAGNVVSGDMTQELILSGADIVKVGIGPGSVCTTRIQTGVGMPQLSAIIDCANVAHGLDGHIIADGGCTCPGDVSKAFGGGADFCMLGGMFAGHDESGGEVIEEIIQTNQVIRDPSTNEFLGLLEEVKKYKTFYGMSSKSANEKYSGGLKKYRSAEGREVRVEYRGPIAGTVQDLLGGIRSTCTYIGAKNLKSLPKCTVFVRVTQQFNGVYAK